MIQAQPMIVLTKPDKASWWILLAFCLASFGVAAWGLLA